MNDKLTHDIQGNIVCAIHRDASVMNRDNECSTCLDDAHERRLNVRAMMGDAFDRMQRVLTSPAMVKIINEGNNDE